MYNYKKLFLAAFCIITITQLSAQEPIIHHKIYPQNYFRAPLDIAPDASGSFGELRSNHFHSGTDYRTLQRVGQPVHAVADGYISRIRVQLGGGGNILYIDHPNGYTSVYMHMLQFNDAVTEVTKACQYSEQRFDVDFRPEKGQLSIKKGDIIGLSGNSGSSGGPHLHFELRDTKTEYTINPPLFGLAIPDKIPPTLSGITIYDLGEEPFSENTPRRHLLLKGVGSSYSLNTDQVIPVNGKSGLGIVAFDRASASAFRYGVYSIELFLDDQLIYTAVWEDFSFEHSRAINSHIDYPYFIMSNKRIQKSFVEPGNPLGIYRNLSNQGIIELNDDRPHTIRYRVRDVQGNSSTLRFRIQRNTSYNPPRPASGGTSLFVYNKENLFTTDQFQLTIPANSLYSDLAFKYSLDKKPIGSYSPLHRVHNRMIPLHNGYQLAIKPDASLPPQLYSKALLADEGKRSIGGRYEDGWVKVTTNTLGSFYVVVDTIAPTIRPVNISEGKSMVGVDRINLKISDNFSGIQSFNGYIDDQWVLMEFDPKTASLWHSFEPTLTKGNHRFKLVVKDWKDNEKIYEVEFLK